MKKTCVFLLIAAIAMLIFSCSNGIKKFDLLPENGDIEIFGDLDDNIVVSKKKPAVLEISEDLKSWTIKIPVQLIEPVDFAPNDYEYFIDVSLSDEKNEGIGVGFIAENYYGKENLTTLEQFKTFIKSEKGKEIMLEFQTEPLEKLQNIPNIKYYSISCDIYEKDNEEFSVSTPNKKGEDWDKIIDEYESFLKKYASYIKKAKEGDVKALTEMAEILEKAESLSEKLENASTELTAQQATRFNKAALEFASEAANMY